MVESVNDLYGPADAAGTSRFTVAGDPRQMYPISPVGSMADASVAPHKVVSGAVYSWDALLTGMKNLITNGSVVSPVGSSNFVLNPAPGAAGPIAVRLGVPTSDTGGNLHANVSEYGFIHPNKRMDLTNRYTWMANGEAVYQDTDLSIAAAFGRQLGQSAQSFFFGAASLTVDVPAVAAGGIGTFATITKNAGTNNFTTATLVNAAGPPGTNYAYTPSLNWIRAGDVIVITQGGNNYMHRVASFVDATHLTITPPWGRKADGTANGATGAAVGLAANVYRTGYNSHSKVIPIFNPGATGTSQIWYNYYCGNHLSFNTATLTSATGQNIGPGTIHCFTREPSGGVASSHFSAPQSGGVELRATDIAYYKSFMLYGFGSAIGWSVAGFPTSFATGFGATDFPATNKTVVANQDFFVGFGYLGENLIAFFQDSMWNVRATGSVPEFDFDKLPEPVGCWMANAGQSSQINVSFTSTHYRPITDGRACVFYIGKIGLMQLTGQTAKKVSEPVNSLFSSFNSSWAPTWEWSNNIVYLSGPTQATGLTYKVDTQSWAIYDPTFIHSGVRGTTGTVGYPSTFQVGLYDSDSTQEKMRLLDGGDGAPWVYRPTNCNWSWSTPVVSTGDQYRGFQVAGFQLDANLTNSATINVYGGKYPYNLVLRDSVTISATDVGNRRIYGMKNDDAFVAYTVAGTSWCQITALNLYANARGK